MVESFWLLQGDCSHYAKIVDAPHVPLRYVAHSSLFFYLYFKEPSLTYKSGWDGVTVL